MCRRRRFDDTTLWTWTSIACSWTFCAWRYIINATVADHTGQQWVSAFGDAGDVLMGMPANALKQLRDDDFQAYEQALLDANFKQFAMKFKVADDTYNDETRVKVSIAKIEPVAFVAESKRMLEQIKKLEAGESIDEPRPAARAPSMGEGGAYGGGGGYGGRGGGGEFGGGGAADGTRAAAAAAATRTSRNCYNCDEAGHWAATAPNVRAAEAVAADTEAEAAVAARPACASSAAVRPLGARL